MTADHWIAIAVGSLATAGLVGLYLVVTRDRGVSVDVADELADAHADSARARAQDELDAAVEAGRRAIVEVDTAADEEVARAGSLADHLRNLSSDG